MARTKASIGVKVASGKSSKARCSAVPENSGSGSTASSGGGSRSSSSGNRVCPRETPAWQRCITHFFAETENKTNDSGAGNSGASSSGGSNTGVKPKPKRNIIQSDDEDTPLQIDEDQPTNRELDETIELEPLTGEESHKIDEFFPKTRSGAKNGILYENEGTDSIKNDTKSESEEKAEINETSTSYKVTSDTKGKYKGQGKKTKEKENIGTNVEKRKSVKRDLEEVAADESSPQNSKKVKVM